MLAPGQIARRMLGRHFEPVGNVYRRIFVDLERVADVFEQELPPNSKVLDIGGGDGALMNRLLNRRSELSITICDRAASIGSFLSDDNRKRVKLLPATDFTDVRGPFDAVTITDVIHHVPTAEREAFFESLAESCERWGCRKLILKDMEPVGWVSKLAVFTDRYVTGDRHVVPFSRDAFAALARRHFPTARRTSKVPDWPNYCEVLSW